jgi:hypothetical protein
MANTEACDSVPTRNKNCEHKVAQLCTLEFGLHSSANKPYDVVPGWLVTGTVFVLRIFRDAVSTARFIVWHRDDIETTG